MSTLQKLFFSNVQTVFGGEESFNFILSFFSVELQVYELLSFVLFNILFVTAVYAISSTHLIYSIINLIITFCLVSILFFFLKVEFIALLVIIIYVGAVAVLFVFIVMMINFKTRSSGAVTTVEHFYSILLSCVLLCLTTTLPEAFEIFLFNNSFFSEIQNCCFLKSTSFNSGLLECSGLLTLVDVKFSNLSFVGELGFFLYSHCFVVLEFCGLLLLVGIVGILLILKSFQVTSKKKQNLTDQLLTSFK